MMKRAKREKFKPIELLNFIHKEQDKRLILENPPKIEKNFALERKKYTLIQIKCVLVLILSLF